MFRKDPYKAVLITYEFKLVKQGSWNELTKYDKSSLMVSSVIYNKHSTYYVC